MWIRRLIIMHNIKIKILLIGSAVFLIFTGNAFAATFNQGSDVTVTSITVADGDTYNSQGYDIDCSGAITVNGTGVLNFTDTAAGNETLANFEGNWIMSATGTFTPSSSTVTFDGTASAALTSGGSSFNNIAINKTSGTDANDNLTVQTNDLTVSGTLTITDGELIQQKSITTGVVTLSDVSGKWTNATDNANVTLSGDVSNTGTISFDAPTGDLIQIRSSSGGTQRDWAGSGTFTMTDVDVQDQTATSGTPSSISVTSGTDSGNNINWIFGAGTVAGRVYDGLGGSAVAAGVTVTVAIYDTSAGTTSYFTDDTDASGDYTITNGTIDTGDVIVAYLDGLGSGNEGTAVTKANANGSSVSGLDIYYNAVDVRDEGGGIANSDLSNIDSGTDDDIKYTVAGGNLSVTSSFALYINTGDTLTPGGNVTVTSANCQIVGTLTLDGAYTLAINTSGTLDIDGTLNLDNNSSAIDVVGAIDLDGTLDASGTSASISLGGNFDATSGTFTAGSSTVTFDGVVAQTITGATTWNNLTISNTHASPSDTDDVDPGAVQTVGGTLNITDGQWTPYTGDDYVNVTIGASGIMKPDASASITVSGNWSNSGTFTANSDTVTFDGTGTQSVTSGGDAFNNLTVTNSANVVTFADAFTAANFTATTPSTQLTFTASVTSTITGTLTMNGQAAGTEVRLRSLTPGTRYVINVTGGAQTVSYVNVQDSNASSNDITASNSIDLLNNDSGEGTPQWVFGTVTRYWVGGAAGCGNTWVDTDCWSTTSGGSGGADAPNTGDTAIFDGGDTTGASLTANVSLAVIDMQAAYTGGSAKLDASGFDITTTSTLDITGGELELDASSGLTVAGVLTVDSGLLDAVNGTIDANSSVALSAGTLIAPSGNFNIADDFSHSGGTFTNSSGTVIFDSAATAVISGNTTFNDLTCTTAGKQLTFTAGTTQTVAGTLTLTGAPGNLILLRSSAASAYTLTFPNGAQTVSLLDVQYSNASTNTVTCVNCLDSGNNNDNWLFDPFGVVFDSLTNNPIQGAVVSLWYDTGGGTWILARPGTEIGAGDSNPQTTGATGAYSYLTINGTYRFTMIADGYTYPSTRTTFPAGRVICPGDAACAGVSGSKGEQFVVAGVAIQMDHPMDGMGSLIQLTKTANKKEASVGDIVTYTLSIENKTASAVTSVYIADRIPPGFKYITDRALLDGSKMNNPEGQRPILFNIGTISAGQTMTLRYQLVVGSGVTFGKYENSAWARYADGTRISNVAKEEVMIIPDPLFDLGTVMGKVFWDINENRVQDGREFISSWNRPATISNRITSTEAGIAGVQIITEEGTIITTDKDGKYHMAGIAPGRHILRIDESTLPEGAYLTTDKAIIIDITPGILQKVNFGVNTKDLRDEEPEAEVSEAVQAPEEPLIPEISVEEISEEDIEEKEYTELEVEEQEVEIQAIEPEAEVSEAVQAPEEPLIPGISVEEISEEDIEDKEYTGLEIEEPRTQSTEPRPVLSEVEGTQIIEAEDKGAVRALIGSAVSAFLEFSEDVIFVGLADVKTGYTSVSGKIEPVEHDDKYTHGFWKEGRLAYYLKGKIKGKFLITSSLDTDREKKEIFRPEASGDPDKYYPVYGDTSTVNYEATDTQGMLFLAVQWDKSKAMWGNYNTGITDTELAQFNRSLYGAKVHFETVSTTEAGKAETKLIFFQARAKQKAAHNEFLGTGGSLYYLKHRPITEGSEKVSLEVRDKNTDMVIATAGQTEGKDYEIDYSNARIIFYEPVTQIAESSTIISSALLDGNPLYVVVDYEYEVSGIYSKDSYGVRVEQSLMPMISRFQISNSKFLKDIRIGGTYIKDDQDTGNYILSGVDTSLYLGEHTLITAEYAQSQAQGVEEFLSTDGGLTFTEVPTSGAAHGKAVSIKAQTRLFDKIGIMSYYKKIDRGFSESSTVSAQGKESAGGEITLDLSEKTHIKITHDMQKLLDEGNAVTASQVGASRTDTTTLQAAHKMDKLKLTGEFRHIEVSGKKDEYISETNDSGSTVALRGDYDINNDVGVFLEQQVTLKQDYQTSAGVSAQVFKWMSLKISETIGTEGNATSISARVKVDDRSEFYNTYSISNSKIDGRKKTIVSGGRTKITDSIELTTEAQNASSESEITRTNIFGLSGEINERWGLTGNYERGMVQSYDGDISKRSAGSIGVSYIERERIKASGKIEIRIDEGEAWQYLSYNAVQWKVNRDTILFGKINLSETINTTLNRTEAEYKEIIIGTAYRPVNFDRLNVIAKYTYLEDETASGQTDMSDIQEQRAHVLAGEAVYDLTDRWQVVEKLAFKQSDERVTGFDFTKSQTVLWINRVNYNLYRDWQVGTEYRILWQKLARDMKEGALIEVSRYLGKNLQIGIGYNFTDFSDDLTYLDYTSQGPFIRFSMKITD